MIDEQNERIKFIYAYKNDLPYTEPPEIAVIRAEYKKTGICKHSWVRDNPNTDNSNDHDWHCEICGQKDIYMGDD